MNPSSVTTPFLLESSYKQTPAPVERVERPHRRIVTELPTQASQAAFADAQRYLAQVTGYQPPIVWKHADGFQVRDESGNCWIDFSSTAVMTNSGHGHPRVRQAVADYARDGMLAQFSFLSEIRVRLAKKLVELSPEGIEKAYFWTTGSEANECALRLARKHGMLRRPSKHHVLCLRGDYHGCTTGAHDLSGDDQKAWHPQPDRSIHRLPLPDDTVAADAPDWDAYVAKGIASSGAPAEDYCAVFVEAIQGARAAPLPVGFVQALRRFADQQDALLVFDEVQTGFGRTGRWFGHEHYGVRGDLLCVGKGLSSSLPIAAVLGPAEVLDLHAPGEVTTTHAGHPLACVAALANLEALEEEDLIGRAEATGKVIREELKKLQSRFPELIADVRGLGLLNAMWIRDPQTGEPSKPLAADLSWWVVRRGVMVFRTLQHTLKICPPLVIPEDAAVDGCHAIGEAIERLLAEQSAPSRS